MTEFACGTRVRSQVPIRTDDGTMLPPGTVGMVVGHQYDESIVVWEHGATRLHSNARFGQLRSITPPPGQNTGRTISRTDSSMRAKGSR